MTPALKVIYKLFEPISRKILIEAFEADNPQEEWQDGLHLSGPYSPISINGARLSEAIYRTEIGRFTGTPGNENHEFGDEPLTQGTMNNREDEVVDQICYDMGWDR